jgi:glycine cleavage system H protein
MVPTDCRYTREHEWIRIEDDIAVLGITDFAQKELGEVVYVDLPEIGHVFDAHDEIGTIESVKAVAEVYTPVAGEVTEINEALADDPQLVNEDPYADGWLVKLKFSSSSDFDDLMNAEEYEQYAAKGKE